MRDEREGVVKVGLDLKKAWQIELYSINGEKDSL
jgi:hypothetical protein